MEHLTNTGAHVEHQHLPGPQMKEADVHTAPVLHHTLESVVKWIAGIYP